MAWPLISLLSGAGLLVISVGALFSVLGLRAGAAEFSTITTGFIMSAYYLGYVGGVYACPLLIRGVGHIRAFAAMASIASTMPILHALWVDPQFWAVLRFITGACLVGLYLVLESWLNMAAPREHRGRIFSYYMTVCFLGYALGQWILLAGDGELFAPFVLASVLFSCALLPITMTPLAEPRLAEAPPFSFSLLWQASPLGVVGSAMAGVFGGAFLSLGAIFAKGVGFSTLGVATFMTAAILGGALSQMPIGKLSDSRDRRYVLLVIAIGTFLASTIIYLLSFWLSPWALILPAITLGAFMFPIYGLSVAHANDQIDQAKTIELTGGLLLVNGLGAASGPIVAGVFMRWFNTNSLFLAISLAALALTVYTVRRIRASSAVPDKEKVDYVPPAVAPPPVAVVERNSNASES